MSDCLTEPGNSKRKADPDSTSTEERAGNRRRTGSGWFGRTAGLLAKLFLALLIAFGILLWGAYRSAQSKPEFYRQVLERSEDVLAESGDEFETKVVELQNSIREEEQWQVVFTDLQVNGWLMSDLPAKFPEILPVEISDPAVEFQASLARLAFQFKSDGWNLVVVAEGDLFTTADNEIGVEIRSLRSGMIPLPVSQWADSITEGIVAAGIPVRWTESNGNPVAVLSIPGENLRLSGEEGRVVIEAIEVQDGQVVIQGRRETTGSR